MIYSPLRYPGGKSRLTKYVEKLIHLKKLNKSTYIEPFCGGAAIALSLLINGHVSDIIINDYDRSIYAFWYSVKNYSEELCSMIKNTEITIEEWHRQRAIQLEKEKKDLLTLGFSTLFLNRTNRSGILKAGVIGGMKQNGNYKLDCRFNKKKIIDKIKLIASYADKIEIYNLDTEKLIDDVIMNLNKKSFIFFDPPYYKKGSSLYTNFYKHEDHLALANKIKNIKYHSWIVTYDNVKEIRDMYKEKRMETYQLNYYAQKKYKGDEVIFYSNTLSANNVEQIKIVDNL
ncbi:DNA adenine methylase [Clostridium botulinum]|uniref:DNA adenine methylase n=1 Tax=Clostridium botulinum TaxID=1491 RepID=UPI00016B98F0|nr:DNA adenine methylase [Clostridium botulinum]APC83455.1 D12 class N6 adenine-specific DNA methyltransferase family protein [Clostridium botulinum]EDT81492.1 DNA-methyltransferase [Clostridium botulinum NCTC 2916]MCS4440195.1 DNA adenine methylase [Clostridium botulinum]